VVLVAVSGVIDLVALQIHTLLVVPNTLVVITVHYLHIGLAFATARHVRDRVDDDFVGGLHHWASDAASVHLLKVLNIAHLRGLSHTLPVAETLPTIVSHSFVCIVSEATE
jgi:hypothetical protein